MRAEVAGTAVDLTPTEFQLLATMAAPARPDLHPRPAARRAARRRLRDVRAGDRFARQEPPPQARARPAPAALRADGLRRRLSLRRRPGGDGCPTDGERRGRGGSRAGRPPGPPPRAGGGDWQRPTRDRPGVRPDLAARRVPAPPDGGGGPRGAVGRPRWMRRRGFGCVFGLLFLFVVGSLVAAMAIVVSRLGPIPGIVAVAGRRRRPRRDGPDAVPRPRRTLDQLVEATRRVEAGDYTVRVDVRPRSTGGLQCRRPADRRVRHDDRAARGRRGPAADAAGRHQPRAAHAADRRPGQPRGDRRRGLSARRGASRRRSSTRRASWAG